MNPFSRVEILFVNDTNPTPCYSKHAQQNEKDGEVLSHPDRTTVF